MPEAISKITNNQGVYVAEAPKKELDKEAFLTHLTTTFGGPEAKLVSEVMHDTFFSPGVGIKALGYTFLLLKTFTELEVDLMKFSNEQMALTTSMYSQMAKAEERSADDIWKKGLAQGISQIAAGASTLAIHAKGAYEQNKAMQTNPAKIKAEPVNGASAQAQGSVARPSAEPAPAIAGTPAAQARGQATPKPASQDTPDIDAGKEARNKATSIGERYQVLGRAVHDIISGAGNIAAHYYEAEAKREEGFKHLIQAVIDNANTNKQRLQQQYEESARKLEQAIEMYNAALQASH